MNSGKKLTGKIRRGYEKVLRRALIKLFPFWQRLGIHVTPNYFYFPIPDTSTLKPDLWEKTSELVGIEMNEEAQVALLAGFASNYKTEYEAFPREKTAVPYQYFVNNSGFAAVDGEILYCLIRHFKPSLIFEIGAGNSTYLAAQAALKNETSDRHRSRLISCEPYPEEIMRQGFPGLTELRETMVQNIPLAEFEALGENDILFIDSSHVLKIGSDVQYEILEILPRLKKGVLIHIHDIFLPLEYPRDWIVKHKYFWNEQYFLQAFLAFNESFEVLWAGSYMRLKHPDKLEAAFSSFAKETVMPGSFWIRKIK